MEKKLEELKALANFIKIKLELDGQLPLYTPEEIEEKTPEKKVAAKKVTSKKASQKETKTKKESEKK